MAKKPTLKPVPMPTSEHQSVRIEKISNGYLVRHSSNKGGDWKETTTFSPTKPNISLVPVKKEK